MEDAAGRDSLTGCIDSRDLKKLGILVLGFSRPPGSRAASARVGVW
jgi:hypothetical protein